MRQKINWAHAQKKGHIPQIAQMVREHDAATPTEQVHLRTGFAVFIQAKFLYLEAAPCVFCGENIAYMNEAREQIAAIAAQVQEQQPTVVEDARKKATKSKRETESTITETDKID